MRWQHPWKYLSSWLSAQQAATKTTLSTQGTRLRQGGRPASLLLLSLTVPLVLPFGSLLLRFLTGCLLMLTSMVAWLGWQVNQNREQALERTRQFEAIESQLREAQQQHQTVVEQTETLTEMNAELMAVQHQLQAQYLALEAANDQLAALATTDGMTGLANHRRFQEEMARQIARIQRTQAPLSLLLLDVDHFKKYNDQFGHPAGDVVLKQVGYILKEIVREGYFPARYGGEEFAVILPDTEADTAFQVAERIRQAVALENFPHREVTVSIGVTQNLPGETAPTLIQRADVALYESKSAGRNCVSVFAPTLPPETEAAQEAATEADCSVLATSVLTTDEAVSGFAEERVPDNSPEQIAALLWAETCQESDALLEAGWNAQEGGLEGLLQEPPALLLYELLAMLDRRHVQPIGHSGRVARYALRLASELMDYYEEQRPTRPLLPRLTAGDLMQLTFGALLHDIGKSGIPDEILRKEGKLNEDEWRQIRRHPLVGVELIASSPLLSRAIPVVRFHHERWDGTGYPQGLAQEAIPLVARIFAVCDTLDTLLTGKAYRLHMTYTATREEIIRASGTQFDPDVVQAFLRVPEEDWYLNEPATSLPKPLPETLRRAA